MRKRSSTVHCHNVDSVTLIESQRIPETFRWASHIRTSFMRLCDYCLKSRRRCPDGKQEYTVKSWKNYRGNQWR